ncbi:MAG: tetratricopeptide repeat protein [Calditrichaeota bacterium]|nr:MAG: tetratricopeptide repeat protein [Calditrichota bacterium]
MRWRETYSGRMILAVWLIVGTSVFFAPVLAQTKADPQTLFRQGNEAYRAGRYEQAAQFYQQILAAGLESPAIYYNLGNCYYKLNQLGQAILYYRKAQRLNPSDRDIAFNLELARLKVIDRIELPEQFVLLAWWNRLVHRFSLNQLAWWLALGFAGTMVLLAIRLLVHRWRWRRLLGWLGTAGGILVVLIALLFWASWNAQAAQREGVILVESVTVHSAPDEQSTDLFVLHEGSEVRVQETRGHWSRIRLLDGKEGWVPDSSLGLI